MATRASKGTGGVRKRSDGRWEGRLQRTDPATGKPEHVSVYGSTSALARAALRDAIDRMDEDLPLQDSTMTVGAWAKQWMDTNLEASTRKPSTKSLYRSLMRTHVIDRPLGKIKLSQLRPSHISSWIIQLRSLTREVKKPDGTSAVVRAFADSSITRSYQTLRVCISEAVDEGLLARNPMEKMKPPRFEKHDAKF